MKTLSLRDAVSPPTEVVTLTVEQYHRMLAAGVLENGDPIELLDGVLVPKDRGDGVTMNPPHSLAMSRLMRLAPRVEDLGGHLRLQSPLTLEPHHEPEPDGMLVRGRPESYADRHPSAADVSCVIEVSSSSLERDRTTKQRIYAAAGIAQYVIVNLVDRRVEVYEEPDSGPGTYGATRVATGEEPVNLRLGKATVAVRASELVG